MDFDLSFYKGKKVLLTGHTGFKGSWMTVMLVNAGAEVIGYSTCSKTETRLFDLCGIKDQIIHIKGDVRDLSHLIDVFHEYEPEIVIHMAAQPIVRDSYADPVGTYETNVMGTVNVCEAVRQTSSVKSFLNVTTDKVYENNEKGRPFRETDPFGGHDPYSASKGACEIVISSYRRSFFGTPDSPVWVASARAGNVIGGGDWAKDRIVPDAMRALAKGATIPVRNSASTRPWQHVLEPLGGYLALGAALAKRERFDEVCGGFNFGPDPKANRTVKELVEEMLKWREGAWVDKSDPNAVHEAGLLNLDIRKARRVLGWKPRWDFEETVKNTVQWYAAVANGANPVEATNAQIMGYDCNLNVHGEHEEHVGHVGEVWR